MPLAIEILDDETFAAVRARAFDIVRPHRRFAVAAGNIEHISRLA